MDSYKVPLPFDCHGVGFSLSFVAPANQREFAVFSVRLEAGAAILKSYTSFWSLVTPNRTGDATWWMVTPLDETKPVQSGGNRYYPPGGKGFYLRAPGSAESLLPRRESVRLVDRQHVVDGVYYYLPDRNSPAHFVFGAGTPVLKVGPDAGDLPVVAGIPIAAGNAQIAFSGMSGITGWPTATAISGNTLMRSADGRIVYVR